MEFVATTGDVLTPAVLTKYEHERVVDPLTTLAIWASLTAYCRRRETMRVIPMEHIIRGNPLQSCSGSYCVRNSLKNSPATCPCGRKCCHSRIGRLILALSDGY